jgi:hypothetical protein
MKIIFLDIDGVLNSMDYMNLLHMSKHDAKMDKETMDEYGQLFDPRCVQWLEYIIAKTGAKIVISSTWRMSGLQIMQELWKHRNLPGEVIDVTGRGGVDPEIIERFYDPGADRGYEIQQWIEDHSDINSYVILDDDSDMCPGQHFVKCDSKYGITREVANAAINYLNFEKETIS